jgi:nucleotide-binding universal stress UspA family protein
LRKRGLSVATHLSPRDPGPGIADASLEYETDIIAMTAHTRPGESPDILGSTAHEVLRSRVEPVLVLRQEDGKRAAQGWTDPPAVIVGLDGSALALTALPHAEGLAASLGAEIVLVRALMPPDPLSGAARYYGAVEDFAERYVAGIAENLRQRGLRVSTRTGHQSADRELISAANSHPGSIIVLSTRGLTGRATLVLGSVTERVVRSQLHPVLAVPAARRTA